MKVSGFPKFRIEKNFLSDECLGNVEMIDGYLQYPENRELFDILTQKYLWSPMLSLFLACLGAALCETSFWKRSRVSISFCVTTLLGGGVVVLMPLPLVGLHPPLVLVHFLVEDSLA